MRRALHLFPRQGDRDPWRNTQNYTLDKQSLREAAIEDGVLEFAPAAAIDVALGASRDTDAATRSAA